MIAVNLAVSKISVKLAVFVLSNV